MDDLRAVLDAVGSERVVALRPLRGRQPERPLRGHLSRENRALVTFGIFAARVWSPEYPWAPTVEARQREIAEIERSWSGEMDLEQLAPTAAGDPVFQRRLATYLRQGASPGGAIALLRMNTLIDIRDVLPTIRVPTLVIHRVDDRDAKVEEGRWIAAQIPGAKFVELPGADHLPWVGDADAVVAEIEEFVTGTRPIAGARSRPRDHPLHRHRRLDDSGRGARRQRAGRACSATTTGSCAARSSASADGRSIGPATASSRSSTGRSARSGARSPRSRPSARSGSSCAPASTPARSSSWTAASAGSACTSARGSSAAAGAGEVLVSRTVTDLVAGSGLAFEDRGLHELKGVPGEWRLFAVVPDDA